MALQFKDRVQETTTTTGTGTLTLAGAVTGYQAFTNALSNGDTCYYAISDLTNNAWEVGLGTFTTSGTTLARTTVLASSNSGSVVTLAAGTKQVFLTEPASVLVPTTGATMTGTLTSQTVTPVTTATYTLGDSSHYYTQTYASRYYLNSTAYLDGTTGGTVAINGNITGTGTVVLTSSDNQSIKLTSTTTPFLTSTLHTEVGGQIIDLGANYYQPGSANTANPGAFFRIDTRAAYSDQLFSVTYQPSPTGSGEVQIFKVSTGGLVSAINGFAPITNAGGSLGTSSLYFAQTYSNRYYLNSTAYIDGGTAGAANLTGSFNQTGNGITIGSSTAGISTTGNDVVLTMNSSNTAFRATRTNTWGDSASALFFEIGNSSDNAVFTLKKGSTIGRLAFTTGVVQFFASYFASLPTPTANNLLELINSSSSKVFSVNNVGKIQLAVGANTSIGTAVLTAGTVTVSTTAVTASSLIFLTCQALGTVTVASALSVGTIVAGTSFVINSAVVTDTSTIGWWIIN